MDDPLIYCLSVLTLLAVPGPTNTLLAASGAAVGFYRSLPLLLGELAGYIISIVTLRGVAGFLVGESRGVEVLLKLVLASYLIFLSIRLWRVAPIEHDVTFTIRRVFVTTLLNPKGLVFAFFIIPANPPNTALYLATFSAMAVTIGMAWISAGNLITELTDARYTRFAPRAASLALAVFAAFVIASNVFH